MSKLIFISLLVLLCVTNVHTHSRFLDDTQDTSKVEANQQEISTDNTEQNQISTTQKDDGRIEQKEATDKTTVNNLNENQENEIPNKEQGQKQNEKGNKEQEQELIIPNDSEDNKTSTYLGLSFGLIVFLLFGVLFFFVGFYRYSLKKYKIPAFSPPNFCPNFLFPRPENDILMEDYYIQSGNEKGAIYSSEKYHNFI